MFTYNYPMQSVVADAVVLCDNQILLVKRNIEPFKGMYALPGGHLDPEDQDTFETAIRELKEETGIDSDDCRVIAKGDVGTFSTKGRDPRGRYVTVAYYFVLSEKPELNIDPEEVQTAEWFPIDKLKKEEIAFDHFDIITKSLMECKEKCVNITIKQCVRCSSRNDVETLYGQGESVDLCRECDPYRLNNPDECQSCGCIDEHVDGCIIGEIEKLFYESN